MYLVDYISEYDIQRGNISIMLDSGYISKERYDELCNMDKNSRVTIVGKMMIEDKELYPLIENGFQKYVDLFIVNNKLDRVVNVLEINHDAVWVAGRLPKKTTFGNIKFIQKRVFTSLYGMQIRRATFYFYLNTDKDIIETRGFNTDSFKLMDRIKDILVDKELNDEKAVYHKLHKLNKEVQEGKFKEPLIKNILNTTVMNRMIKDLIRGG